MKKYAEIPKNDVGFEVEGFWFKNCRKKNVPFITLGIKGELADVHWDYISYPNGVDKVLKSLDGYLQGMAISIFNKCSSSRSRCEADDFLVWFKSLEVAKARLAAEELYDLVTACVEKNIRGNQE